MGSTSVNDSTPVADPVDSLSSIDGHIHVVLKLLIFLTVGLIMTIDILTGIAMSKTKRIPFATKLLTCLSLVCDVAFVFAICMTSICIAVGEGPGCIALGTEMGRITVVLSWVSITMMLVERLVCIWYPNMYARNAQNKRITLYTISTMITVVLMKLFTRYIILPCARKESFDMVAQTRDEHIMMWLLGICLGVGVFCYIAIIKIVRRHARQIADLKHTSVKIFRTYKSTKSIFIIFVAFLCVHVPLFITFLWKNIIDNTDDLRLAVLASMLIISIVNPFLYAWRFKECRFIMIKTLSKLCNTLTPKVEAMRHDVYNVVTNSLVSSSPVGTFHITESNLTMG